MTQNLRRRLRFSRAYRFWRHWRERGQLARFNAVLDAELGEEPRHSYSEAAIHQLLSQKRQGRRPWPLGSRPVVLGFGARDWEQFGLWPTLERVADLQLSLYGTERAIGPDRTIQQRRLRQSQGFLRLVDEIDTARQVNAAFIYASAEDFDEAMIDGLAHRGIWSIVMGLDDKHQFFREPGARTSRQLRLAAACDLYWTTWRTGAEIVVRKDGNPWYAPSGADPAFHRPRPASRDIEVLFLGQSYGIRSELVQYLRARGFGVEAYGSGWPNGFVDFEKTVELYGRAEVVLGVGSVRHMTGVKHLKGRDFEVPMCGALYVTSFNPELTDWFNVGREILCYSSFEECADLLHWVRRHPQEADSIRRAALARSLRDHTWEARFSRLFSMLGSVS